MAWVYILRGARRYYIGATENFDRRIAEHKRGSNHTTRRFGEELLVAAVTPPQTQEESAARNLRVEFKKDLNT